MSQTSDEALRPQRPSSRRRIIALLLLGFFVICGGAIWKYFRFARPIGAGPVGIAVKREAFQNIWSDRKVVLLGLGDSVTQGLGASPGKDYFNLLVESPVDEFSDVAGINLHRVFPNLQKRNLAISGMTSLECVAHQLPKLESYDSEVFGLVVITTGGNDVIHNYGRTPPREGAMYGAKASEIGEWVRNFDQRLETIAERVRETFPGGCKLFLANIYDPTDDDGDTLNAGLPSWPDGVQVLQAYNDVITRFTERNPDVTLIDMRAAFLGHGVHCTQFWHRHYQKNDPHYWYWDNLEDPNDRGYAALRRLFLNGMAEVLPKQLLVDPRAAVH